MRKTLLAGALAALTIAAGGAALAQQAPVKPHAMRADADGDGRISQAEFVARRVDRLTAADADRDGSVAPEEVRAASQARRVERADTRFQRLDADRDGTISRAEFDAPRAARADRTARPARMNRGGPRMTHRGQRMQARGPISIAEVQGKAEQAFTRLDVDRDGFVTAAERQTGRQAIREQRRERMAERRAARQAQRQASPPAPASE